jgi:hypothetical protein
LNHEPFKNLAEGIQSIVTSVALIVGGIWAGWRFVLTREGKALIEPELDIIFVQQQNGRWIIELVAVLNNKGRAQLRIRNFGFELRYSVPEDNIESGAILIPDVFHSQKELKFPAHLELKGSWLDDDETIILEPGVRYRHSISTSVPNEATAVLATIQFEYPDGDSEMEVKFIAPPGTNELSLPQTHSPGQGRLLEPEQERFVL